MSPASGRSSYIVSALRHRPSTFAEVLGQEHVTRTLMHSLERGRMANAYLFAGPRGTGKTSTARVLAKALNCFQRQGAEPCNRCDSCISINKGTSLDILEIDAASNRGVDDIRNLRENVRFAPTQAQYRVLVIDEVHMLTPEANNALLKTLEEPPPHIKFVLATTEMHKIPATILSRCQRFRFRRIPINILMDKLGSVAAQESGIDLGTPAERDRILFHIARVCEGSLRDALVALDQLLSFCSGQVSLAQAEEILGVVEFEALETLVRSVLSGDSYQILLVIDRLCSQGKEPAQFLKEILAYLRHLLAAKVAPDRPELVELPAECYQALHGLAESTSLDAVLQIIEVFSEAERRMRYTAEGRMVLEVTALKAAKIGESVSLAKVLSYLSELAAAGPSTRRVAEQPAPPAGHRPAPEVLSQSGLLFTENSGSTAEKSSATSPESTERSSLESAWRQVAKHADFSAPIISTALEQSSPVAFEDGHLTVAVPNKSCLHQLSNQGYREKICRKLSDILGRPVTVTYILGETAGFELEEMRKAGESPPERGERLVRAREHAVIRSLMEHIPGEVIDVRPERH